MGSVLNDLTGHRFGRLVVVERVADDYVAPSGKRFPRWRVACDCGTETTVRGSQMRSGRTRSCGCAKSAATAERGRTRLIDMTGQRFGALLVLDRAEDRVSIGGKAETRWRVLCDCGREATTAGTRLRSGVSRSCGCGRGATDDLTGDVYGRLTVTAREGSRVAPDGGRTALWRCRCECGAETVVPTARLRNGHTRSCGCLNRETAAANGRARAKTPGKPGYQAAHERVKRLHGVASTHACVDCGSSAQQWSYDHGDPDEQTGPDTVRGKVRMLAFSNDPAYYSPRCGSCHKRFDNAHASRSRPPSVGESA